jgi:hypothetical protein
MNRVVGVGAAAVVVGYAWIEAGIQPFSFLSYVLVGIPSLAMLGTYCALGGLSPRRSDIGNYYRRKAVGASLHSVAPWLIVLAAGAILESVGLALGGRSSNVPTLSTTVDHLLVVRWGRWILCVTWLLAGAAPLLRLWRFLGRRAP